MILDPLVLTLVYLFVFTIISHREDAAAIFGFRNYKRAPRALMVSSSPLSLKAQSGFPIERVRTRVLISQTLQSLDLTHFSWALELLEF